MSWAETIWLKSKIEDALAMSKRYVDGTENDQVIFEKKTNALELSLSFIPKCSGTLTFSATNQSGEPTKIRATLTEDDVILSQHTDYGCTFNNVSVAAGKEYRLYLEDLDYNGIANRCAVLGAVVDVGYFDAS